MIQGGRERAMVRAVEVGEDDRVALNSIRLESVAAFHARLNALAKTRAAFSALEDAVQAPLLGNVPLGNVLWTRPARP